MSVHMIKLYIGPFTNFGFLKLTSYLPEHLTLHFGSSQITTLLNKIKNESLSQLVHLLLDLRAGLCYEKGVCPFIN